MDNPWNKPKINSTAVERWRATRIVVAAKLKADGKISNDVLNLSGFIEREEFLGGGSFGDVYKARLVNVLPDNGNPFRVVPFMAVKIMRVGLAGDETMKRKRLKYLEQEIEVGKTMNHKNILSLVGVATMERDLNQPALVTLWMPNGTVLSFLARNPDTERLPLLAGIIDGLVYLHSHNPQIVHGDLKPDNVLVDENGNPLLCDFGLSRILADTTLWRTTATHAGGTLRYLAPELLNGTQSTVSTAGDVYAYAMTAYQIMTGAVPFHEYQQDFAVVNAVVTKNIRPTLPKNATISNSLWCLMEACWSTDPDKRLTVNRMQSIIHDIGPTRDRSVESTSQSLVSRKSIDVSLESMLATGSEDCTIRLWDSRSKKHLTTLVGHDGGVTSVAFSPDGKRLYSGCQDRSVRIWDAENGLKLSRIDFKHEIWCVAVSPCGNSFACSGSSWSISILDADPTHDSDKSQFGLYGHEDSVRAIDFSRTAGILVSGSDDKTVRVWDVNTRQTLKILKCHHGFVASVAFSPNGKQMVSGSLDGIIAVWHVESGQPQHRLKTQSVRSVKWSADGGIIGAGLDDGTVQIWNAVSGDTLHFYRGHTESVRAIEFSPDGRCLISASYDKTIRIWDCSELEGKEMARLEGHTKPIKSIAFFRPMPKNKKPPRSAIADPFIWGFGILNRRKEPTSSKPRTK